MWRWRRCIWIRERYRKRRIFWSRERKMFRRRTGAAAKRRIILAMEKRRKVFRI